MKNALMLCGLLMIGCGAVAWAGPTEKAGPSFVAEHHTTEVGESEIFFVIQQYLIEVEDPDAKGITLSGSRITLRSMVPLVEDLKLQVGNLVLSVGDSGELLGNGSPDFQPEDGFRVVSAPQIVTTDGDDATVRSGGYLPFQYMVRQPDGDFRLTQSDPGLELGFVMNIVVRSLGEIEALSDEIDLEYSVKTTFLAGRETIDGVNLEIGKPIVFTREVQTRMNVPLDAWMLLQSISAMEGPNGDPTLLIVMMRILEKTR